MWGKKDVGRTLGITPFRSATASFGENYFEIYTPGADQRPSQWRLSLQGGMVRG